MSKDYVIVDSGGITPAMQNKLEELGFVVIEKKQGAYFDLLQRPVAENSDVLNSIWTALGRLLGMVELLVKTLPKPVNSTLEVLRREIDKSYPPSEPLQQPLQSPTQQEISRWQRTGQAYFDGHPGTVVTDVSAADENRGEDLHALKTP